MAAQVAQQQAARAVVLDDGVFGRRVGVVEDEVVVVAAAMRIGKAAMCWRCSTSPLRARISMK